MGRQRVITLSLTICVIMLGLASAARAEPAPGTPAAVGEARASEPVKAFDLEKTIEAARLTVRQFKERLRTDLHVAVKGAGAANAISLCQTIAPDLATALTDKSGFEVTRTSLKLRNPENAPNAWELEVLKSFQEKAAAGADPDKLEQWIEVATPEGDRLWRYMRGIAIGDVCLSCHGTEIKADVRSELTRYYPDDKAVGYKLGELRGAFSLVKLIGE